MRVVVHEQLDITDEQRVQIANVLDGKVSRRQATRDEIKNFCWVHGANWSPTLADLYGHLTGNPVQHNTHAEPTDDVTSAAEDLDALLAGDDDEDLIGGTDDNLDDLL